MNELTIQTRGFDNVKNQLKEFSEKVPERVDLSTVATNGGWFNLFDHNVTGEELNNLTFQIQKFLIAMNNLHIETIKEFGQVYNALEALDKDYIQSIIISIKAAEEASSQAKDAQKDINKTIEVQKQTINILKQFKDKIEKYEYLENIDDIWNDYQIFKDNLMLINAKVEDNVKLIETQIHAINDLKQFKEKIDKYEHLNNIDEIWSDFQTFRQNIKLINFRVENNVKSIETQKQAINDLKQFKEQIDKYEHLKNIDEIWSDSQTFKKDVKSVNAKVKNLVESIQEQKQAINTFIQFKEQIGKYEHLENIDEIWNEFQTFKEDTILINAKIENQKKEIDIETKLQISYIRNMINEDKINYEKRNKMLTKKLKIAYILAGSSVSAILLNFVLHILGVI